MSSFIYPNSATRKMFGQAGNKMRNQAKRFSEIFSDNQRENEAKRKGIITDHQTKLNQLQAKHKREKVVILVIAGFVIVSLVCWIIFF